MSELLKLQKHRYYMQNKVKANWPYCTLCHTKLRIFTLNLDSNERTMHASCQKIQKKSLTEK